MNKASQIFWCDALLLSLLAIVVLMVIPEVATHAYMHVIPGLLMMLAVAVHLWLHRSWIAVAFKSFRKMPQPAQINAGIDLALLGAYLFSGAFGLFARLLYFVSPHQHFHLGVLHAILSGILLTLQLVHLARHFQWIKKNFRARLIGASFKGV